MSFGLILASRPFLTEHCSAVPGMQVYAAGGDNEDTPDWYIGYLPSLASIVIVHQGTTPENLESDYVRPPNHYLCAQGDSGSLLSL